LRETAGNDNYACENGYLGDGPFVNSSQVGYNCMYMCLMWNRFICKDNYITLTVWFNPRLLLVYIEWIRVCRPSILPTWVIGNQECVPDL